MIKVKIFICEYLTGDLKYYQSGSYHYSGYLIIKITAGVATFKVELYHQSASMRPKPLYSFGDLF